VYEPPKNSFFGLNYRTIKSSYVTIAAIAFCQLRSYKAAAAFVFLSGLLQKAAIIT